MSKDAMFLVKVQINTQGDPFAMPIMVYDKNRKVQAYVTMANALGGVGKLVNGVKILGIKGIELGILCRTESRGISTRIYMSQKRGRQRAKPF